jgi:hypothetical protein
VDLVKFSIDTDVSGILDAIQCVDSLNLERREYLIADRDINHFDIKHIIKKIAHLRLI